MLLDVPGFITSLGLPDGCRVDQRVPKKLLLESGAPTAADKRLIADIVKGIQWVAALKPNTIGVPDYCDELREVDGHCASLVGGENDRSVQARR